MRHEALQGLCMPGGKALSLMVQGRSWLVTLAVNSGPCRVGEPGKALLLVHLWWGPGVLLLVILFHGPGWCLHRLLNVVRRHHSSPAS